MVATRKPLECPSRRQRLEAVWAASCLRCEAPMDGLTDGSILCTRCAADNDLEQLSALADSASAALRADRAALSCMLTGMGLAALGVATWLARGMGPAALGLAIAGACLYVGAVWQFRSRYPWQAGWKRVVAAYHLLALAGLVLPAAAGLAWAALRGPAAGGTITLGCMLGAVALGPLLAWRLPERWNPWWIALRRHWLMARRAALQRVASTNGHAGK